MPSRLLAFALTVLSSSSLAADVLEVPSEYPTIQAALDAAVDGDEVLVAPGVYPPFEFPPKQVLVHSELGPQVTIVNAARSTSAVLFQAGTTVASVVEGLTLTGGLRGFGGGITMVPGAGATIRGNWIIDNEATFDGGGIFPRPENRVVIEENLIGWNRANGQAGGLQAPSSDSVVRRNAIVFNEAANGGAYFTRNESSVTLEHNSFYGNIAPNGSVFAGDGGLTLVNCVIAGHQAPMGFLYGGGTATARYSLVEGGMNEPWFGIGCLDAAPLLLAPQVGDLRLTRESPCVNAGDPSYPADPDGTRADMGAFHCYHRPDYLNAPPTQRP